MGVTTTRLETFNYSTSWHDVFLMRLLQGDSQCPSGFYSIEKINYFPERLSIPDDGNKTLQSQIDLAMLNLLETDFLIKLKGSLSNCWYLVKVKSISNEQTL